MTKSEIESKLRGARLRPTRQRVELAGLMFGTHDRHLTAEALHKEAQDAGVQVSLATVYNTLHQFTDAGLLREITVKTDRSYFDTNTGPHHHFYFESDNRLEDIPADDVVLSHIPDPPGGAKISRIDVIVRVDDTGIV